MKMLYRILIVILVSLPLGACFSIGAKETSSHVTAQPDVLIGSFYATATNEFRLLKSINVSADAHLENIMVRDKSSTSWKPLDAIYIAVENKKVEFELKADVLAQPGDNITFAISGFEFLLSDGSVKTENNTLNYSLDVVRHDDLFGDFEIISPLTSPYALTLADFNNDQKNDIAMVTNSYLCMLMQRDEGGFAPLTCYLLYDNSVGDLASGDLNGDGRIDIVAAGYRSIVIFYQNADSSFSRSAIDTGVMQKIEIADLNHDGLLDLTAVITGTVNIYYQQADGTLTDAATLNVSLSPTANLKIGDLNNDGWNDIVLLSDQDNHVDDFTIFFQQESGFSAPAYAEFSNGDMLSLINNFAIGDVNADGINDLVLTYGGNVPNSGIALIYNNSDGTFASALRMPTEDLPYDLEIADINGDGRNDVVVGHGGTEIGVYLQDTWKQLEAEQIYINRNTNAFHLQTLVVGDINNDAIPDVVTTDINYGVSVIKGL